MTFRYRTNVSDSRNLGMELLLEGDVIKALSHHNSRYRLNLYTNLSLIDARYVNTDNTAIADKLVENVPPVLFRTGLSFGTPKFNLLTSSLTSPGSIRTPPMQKPRPRR